MTTALDLTSIDYSHWMKQALSLAARGAGFTHPNPCVGAVVLDAQGNLAGRGFHERAGSDHAERTALNEAGARARGGTLVVTLEPCCHHGRTPPCTDAIIAAGVVRVVSAMSDPDHRVAGQGFARLVAAGVEVVDGIESAAAERLNLHYLHHRRTGTPWVTLKLGLSLDGRMADASGRSRWITSTAARHHAHALRALHDAILVGAETARRDDPELLLHGAPGLAPRRFVLVGRRDLPRDLKMFSGDARATRIGVDDRADWTVSDDGEGRPDIEAVVKRMGSEGLTGLLVEGGGVTAAAFLKAGVVRRLVLYYGPLLLGEGQAPLGGLAYPLALAPTLTDVAVETFEGGFVVSGLVETR